MTTNKWICNVVMLCPMGLRSAAATMASMMSGNPMDNSPEFFSRAVCPIGSEVVTHYLAHSRMREKVLDQLPMISTMFDGALYYVTQHDEDSPEQSADRLTVDQWLETLGLQLFVEVDDELPDDEGSVS